MLFYDFGFIIKEGAPVRMLLFTILQYSGALFHAETLPLFIGVWWLVSKHETLWIRVIIDQFVDDRVDFMFRPTGTEILADSHAGNHGKRVGIDVDRRVHLLLKPFYVKG